MALHCLFIERVDFCCLGATLGGDDFFRERFDRPFNVSGQEYVSSVAGERAGDRITDSARGSIYHGVLALKHHVCFSPSIMWIVTAFVIRDTLRSENWAVPLERPVRPAAS